MSTNTNTNFDTNTSIAITDVHDGRRPTTTVHLPRLATAGLLAVAAFGTFAGTADAANNESVKRFTVEMYVDESSIDAVVETSRSSTEDGIVDDADFDVWATNSGRGADADFNADGVVDAADYLVWRDHAAAADEPHTSWIELNSVNMSINEPMG